MASIAGNPKQQGGRSGEQEAPAKDLNDLLSPEHRRELINLVARTMDLMEQYLSDDSTSPGLYDGSGNDAYEDKERAYEGREKSPEIHREKSQSPRRKKGDSSMAEVKAEAELARHFGAWRESVLSRVGEVVKGFPPTPAELESGSKRTRKEIPIRTSSADRRKLESPAGQFKAAQTVLDQLPIQARLNITDSLLLLLISLKHYNAHSRVLLVHITSSLGLSVDDLANHETKIARGLITSVKEMSGDKEAKAKAEKSQTARRWKVGVASVAGAALIGVTGGLAAPLVAAGLGAVMGTLGLGAVAGYLGVVAGSSVIVGGLFGAYGARMTGKMMDRYTGEVEDFAFLPIRGSSASSENEKPSESADNRLRVSIGISGWLTEEDDIVYPWRVLGDDSDVFALRWEMRALLKLGNALTTVVKNTALSVASSEVLKRTIFAPIVGALMVPMALKNVSRLVDNPFRVAQSRADKAGEILADALINKAQGERPVTLIGYSLGARVIFSCLTSLAKRRAFGLIESAILIGTPTPSTRNPWRMMRTVVSGRLINVFSKNDSILTFLYRTNSMQFAIAGIEPIANVKGVENFDLSDTVSGHLRYQYMTGKILQMIGVENLNEKEVQAQEEVLQAKDEEEKRRRTEKAQRLNLDNPDQLTEEEQENLAGLDREVSLLEREIEQDTEKGLIRVKMREIEMEDSEKR